MKKILILSACAGFCAFTAVAAVAADSKPAMKAAVMKAPAYAAAAVADTSRPKADLDQDAHRKPAEMLAFAGIKPGSTVAELLPGGGYFTRVFGKAVMPGGHVYALSNPGRPGAVPAAKAIADDPKYAGAVSYVEGSIVTLKAPKPVDVVWTSRNYHDIPAANRGALNQTALEMLKPGGLYIIVDHSAVVGTGNFAMEQPGGAGANLHRIDENQVKLEVLKAGFKLVGESDALRNPADTRTNKVFESTVRGETDQFVLKFQKPSK
jgi:predicted methyltransferase